MSLTKILIPFLRDSEYDYVIIKGMLLALDLP